MCQLAASWYVIQMIIQVGTKRCQHKSTSCSSIFPWTNLGFPSQLWGPEDIKGILGHFRSFLESDMFGWKIYLSHPFSTWFTIERTSVPLFTQTQITTEIHGVFGDVFGTSTRFKIFWEDRKHRPENKFRALQHSKQICLVLLGGWAKPSKRRQLRESSNRPMSDGF